MTIEVLDGLKRKVSFKLDESKVKELTKQELNRFSKKAKAPGFRSGKVPFAMVEQMYGFEAYKKSMSKLVNQEFDRIMQEHNLNIAYTPALKLDDQGESGLHCDIEFEVMPEITLSDLSNKDFTKTICKISDKEVEKTIGMLCKLHAEYLTVERACVKDDKVTINFVGTVNGEAFADGSANDYTFILGDNQTLADFENGILGMTIGETKAVAVNFPENYGVENLKGKTANFAITLNKVEEPKLVELTEEFIKSLGVSDGNVETLKKEVAENLNKAVQMRLKARLREAALSLLLEVNPIDVPHSLVHDEIHHLIDNAKQEFQSRKQLGQEQPKFTHEMFAEDAKKIVSLRLLMDKLVEEHKITVTDDDVIQVIKDMSLLYEYPYEYIKWCFKDKKRMEQVRAIALEEKAIEKIISLAKVVENEVTYDELIKQF